MDLGKIFLRREWNFGIKNYNYYKSNKNYKIYIMREKITKFLAGITGLTKTEIHLETPENEEFGDYTTNIAMQKFVEFPISNGSTGSPSRAKSRDFQFPIEKIKTPRALAEKIVEKLREDKALLEIVDKIEIAGPGFINFWLKNDVLLNNLIQIDTEKENYGRSEWGKGKIMVIDYSAPNIAKRFSIGHLRSTIIGQALYNLYNFSGWKTVGDNHLGDWGTQFGVLIYMVENRNVDPEKLTIEDWEKHYVEFHKEAEKDPDLKDKARDAFKRLEDGDENARNIWKKAYETSIREYDRIYERLNVNIDYAYGESFYEDKMPEAISLAKEKGVAVPSEGALAVEFPEKYKLPSNLLVKTNGTTTYMTRDLALMLFRKREWNPDLQIFEVGADQKLYFQQVFALAEMVGLFKLDQLKHVAHGMIRFKEGKMSTRQGKTVKLEEVLDEAVDRARAILDKPQSTRDLSDKEKEKISEIVGIGAVKYFDLMHHPTSDILFEWEKMFVLEGNSGPYLQYTYARTQSVLKKSPNKQINKYPNKLIIKNLKLEINNEEKSLLRAFVHFSEIIENAAINYSPNLLANYLFDLAQKFNLFYNLHGILEQRTKNKEQSEFRLLLTSAVGQILKNGLNLLGISAPEKM